MQGNCSSEPSTAALGLSGPDLLPRRPGQCVLVTDTRFMAVKQSLWLENLYIRHHTTSSTDTHDMLNCLGQECQLWLNSVRLQEDDSQFVAGASVGVSGGQLYAEGAGLLALCTLYSVLCTVYCILSSSVFVLGLPDLKLDGCFVPVTEGAACD
jgi:hypothetical protein